MDGLQQKEMFVQKVGTSGPLVRSPTNGRASRASLPQAANPEPVTIRQYGRNGRAPWKTGPSRAFIASSTASFRLIPTSFSFRRWIEWSGWAFAEGPSSLRSGWTGRVESQRMFAVGPEVRPYPGTEGQNPKAMGPGYNCLVSVSAHQRRKGCHGGVSKPSVPCSNPRPFGIFTAHCCATGAGQRRGA